MKREVTSSRAEATQKGVEDAYRYLAMQARWYTDNGWQVCTYQDLPSTKSADVELGAEDVPTGEIWFTQDGTYAGFTAWVYESTLQPRTVRAEVTSWYEDANESSGMVTREREFIW